MKQIQLSFLSFIIGISLLFQSYKVEADDKWEQRNFKNHAIASAILLTAVGFGVSGVYNIINNEATIKEIDGILQDSLYWNEAQKIYTLHSAVKNRNHTKATSMLSLGMNPASKLLVGKYDLLIAATENGDYKMVELLLDANAPADGNIFFKTRPPHSFRHLSNYRREVKVIENSQGDEYKLKIKRLPPLHTAVVTENIDLVKLLLKRGANPNLSQSRSLTFPKIPRPLMIAKSKDMESLLRFHEAKKAKTFFDNCRSTIGKLFPF